MVQKLVFVNRRRGTDRRFEKDPCKDLPVDLYHRKRRKSKDRRDATRTLIDDYYAYMQKIVKSAQAKLSSGKTDKPSREK